MVVINSSDGRRIGCILRTVYLGMNNGTACLRVILCYGTQVETFEAALRPWVG